MKTQSFGAFLNSSALVTVFAIGVSPAFAQDASNTAVIELDKIVVTGEKLNRSVEDTASSVAVVTDEDLEAAPEEGNLQDAAEQAANIVYPATVGGAPVIRGQATQGPTTGAVAFFSGTAPRSTINVDGQYQNFWESTHGMTSVWDVDSIEIFRGPQTTSQGANSIAGAMVVNTKDPTFTPEGAFRAEYGSYNTRRVSGMLSGPLGEQFAARATLDYYGRESFIDYVNSSYSEGRGSTDLMALNGRAKLLWQPTNLPGLTAKLTYALRQSNQPTHEADNAVPYNSLVNTATNMPSFYTRSHTGIADVAYEFENGLVLSNSAQISDKHMRRFLLNMNTGAAKVNQLNMSNETLLKFGAEDTALSGVAGVFVSRTTSDEALEMDDAGDPVFDDTKTNLGIFAEADYRFLDRWMLTGGLRFEADQVERSGRATKTPGSYTAVDFSYDETFMSILPKLALAYEVSDSLTIGGLVSRGFTPGGVAVNFTDGAAQPYKAETSWNYELFARAKMFDDRLNIATNVFFNDLSNAQRYFAQRVSPTVTNLKVLNAEKAYSYGVEFEMDYQILDTVNVSANVGLLSTEIEEFSGRPSDEGNEFSTAPSYKVGFGVDWTVFEKLTLSGDVEFTDGYYSDDANTLSMKVDPYVVANASATFQVNDNFQLYSYVNNIFDERKPTFIDRNGGAMTAPRMIGVGLQAKF